MCLLWDEDLIKLTSTKRCNYLVQDEGYVHRIPERTLMAAVLDRAYRDLYAVVEAEVRRTAITWFLADKSRFKEDFSFFTFAQVAEALELSSKETAFLEKAARAAKEHLNNPYSSMMYFKPVHIRQSRWRISA